MTEGLVKSEHRDPKDELLRLMALLVRWPRGGGQEEFTHKVELERAIDKLAGSLWGPQLKIRPVTFDGERIVDVSVGSSDTDPAPAPAPAKSAPTVRCDGCGVETDAFTSSAPTEDKFCTECLASGRAQWPKLRRLEYIDIQDLARLAETLKPSESGAMADINLADVSEHLDQVARQMGVRFERRTRLRELLKEAGQMFDDA